MFSVNQVIVPVTVKDSEGRLVPDLRKDEFRIFEDNVEQRIAYFSNEAFPLSMVVLIDNDLKRKDAEEVAASLRSILAGMSTADEADICRFDQFFHPGKGFNANQDQLLTQLKRTGAGYRACRGAAFTVHDERPDDQRARGQQRCAQYRERSCTDQGAKHQNPG